MKLRCFVAVIVSGLLCGYSPAQAQTLDTELSTLTEKLATQIKDRAKKKVTVLDFTDLGGGANELGRYIAEQLTVNLVIGNKEFSVLDRANLKSILAEHKLTATGLVDPENAKKLGQFAGVDALILGNMVHLNQTIQLTVKIITTDTAEIVGAAKATIKEDDTIRALLPKTGEAQSASGTKPTTETSLNEPKREVKKEQTTVVKSLGDLRVELQPLQIVNGRQYLLTMTLANPSKKPIWVALGSELNGNMKATLTDPNGSEFLTAAREISGVECAAYVQYSYYGPGFDRATEIKPGDSLEVTVKFYSLATSASPGRCNLRMEFLCASDFKNNFAHGRPQNFVTKIEAAD